MSKIRVGFIGYGTSVRLFHLPFVQAIPDIEVYAFLQRSEAPSANSSHGEGVHCTLDHPEARHYRTLPEFLADKKIDLVVICTKPATHAEIALQAIEAGKHVLVEKPFTPTSAEADRVIAAAEQKGVVLSVYHNRRYDNDFLTLKHWIDQGVLGDILEAELHHDLQEPSFLSTLPIEREPGHSMAFMAGSHPIHQALVLFGRPRSITAFLRTCRGVESDNEDSYTITLEYDSPLLVQVKTQAISIMPEVLTSFVRGTRGSFMKFGTDPQLGQILEKNMTPETEGYGLDPQENWAQLCTKEKVALEQSLSGQYWVGKPPSLPGSWPSFYTDLVKAVRGQGPVVVDARSARDTIRILEYATESVKARCTVDCDW
ncbi:hypothetical protein IAR55_005588 [Kwoniella newhampshirensis]|uniref:Gfo/Idh/MocA-like oxidoreductase N-terminal domain-containing protein n=1 Tax=Kwoniella newhampshirensis TaxID=1651941 RepID=A0AAW0YI75_9TREE